MVTLAFTPLMPIGFLTCTMRLPLRRTGNTMIISANPDWFAVVSDPERAGITQREIGACIGVLKSTVNSCKQYGQPRYCNGVALLKLWKKRTAKGK